MTTTDETKPPKEVKHPCANCGVHVVLMPPDRAANPSAQAEWMHIPEGAGFAAAYLHCHEQVATP